MKRIIGAEVKLNADDIQNIGKGYPVYLDDSGELHLIKSGDCCCNLELDGFHSDLIRSPIDVPGIIKELKDRNEIYLKHITNNPASLRSDIGRAVTKLDANFGCVNDIIKTILDGLMANTSLGIVKGYSNIVLPKCMDSVSSYSTDIQDAMRLLVASVARDVCAYDDTLGLRAYLDLAICPLSVVTSPFGDDYKRSIFIKTDCSAQPSIYSPVKYHHVIFDFKSCEIKEYLSEVDFAGNKNEAKQKSKVTATFDVDRFNITRMMNAVCEIDDMITRSKK